MRCRAIAATLARLPGSGTAPCTRFGSLRTSRSDPGLRRRGGPLGWPRSSRDRHAPVLRRTDRYRHPDPPRRKSEAMTCCRPVRNRLPRHGRRITAFKGPRANLRHSRAQRTARLVLSAWATSPTARAHASPSARPSRNCPKPTMPSRPGPRGRWPPKSRSATCSRSTVFALPHPIRTEGPPGRARPPRRRAAGTDRHRRGADPRPDQHARRGYGPAGPGTCRPRSGGTARRAVTGTHGDSLLDANLPLIHTVGRASDEDPRLIDMTWGEAARF
jgi:hypothetical protein